MSVRFIFFSSKIVETKMHPILADEKNEKRLIMGGGHVRGEREG